MSFMSEVRKYLASRKDVKKAMSKAFKVKESEGTNKNHGTPAVINMLKELDAVTVAMFESLLSFIADTNELEKVDAALNALITHKSKKSDYAMQVENVQIWLQDLEANIQDIEGLECLFRCLIKASVSLNIFNH
ncbi:hypothetical protein ACE6H2_005817 [Prunus campanulata]